eukprot:TRINITY_DN16263_c0_g1_i1.p1 TRINITY_DN16263_c0_g1~~TRINITY_DN16263_c0_g1_i1.p1  ORF type:complete len:123 (-),score=33.32 TRINITY_DN16263_c0_g1_i1:207-575(-)
MAQEATNLPGDFGVKTSKDGSNFDSPADLYGGLSGASGGPMGCDASIGIEKPSAETEAAQPKRDFGLESRDNNTDNKKEGISTVGEVGAPDMGHDKDYDVQARSAQKSAGKGAALIEQLDVQ